ASLAKAAIENVHGERPRRRRAVPALPRALPLRAIGRVAAVAAGVLLVGAVTVTAYRAQWRPGVPQFLTRLAAATMRERQPAPRPSTASAPRPFDVPGPTPAAASPLPESRPAKIVAPGVEATGNLLARAIGLWGVSEDLSAAAVSAWPVGPDGELDVPGIASRYQLAATHLSDATLEELRAMDLPAILDMNGGSPRRPALLRRLDGTAAVLLSPSGEETRVAIGDLESSWAHSAWVIWRNVDQLPLDPIHDMTPIVLTTLALRLQKLGLLEGPMPTSYTEGFRQAVRRFQESMGIEPDGLVGPKTTLALSRVVSGRFGPSLAENAAR
ncbi:MAG TPA: peptidoglycan-binding protein, partial [Candidatus Methylomirabilis sp.]|nr:peptidoglycan-binding protein [Candidatus Methylomirabilis sp.]